MMDKVIRMNSIEKTFEWTPYEKHYSKPNVYPVETLIVWPDFKVTLNIFKP